MDSNDKGGVLQPIKCPHGHPALIAELEDGWQKPVCQLTCPSPRWIGALTQPKIPELRAITPVELPGGVYKTIERIAALTPNLDAPNALAAGRDLTLDERQRALLNLGFVEPASKPGSRGYVAEVMERVFEECRGLRKAGQKEYAHDDSNSFANFEDDAEETGISREAVLAIFANKHWRGIRSWIRGHKSQRENVRGRINDMIVYLVLLRAMVEASEVP